MKMACRIGFHRWFYYSEYTRGCKICGRHEDIDPYYDNGNWTEIENQAQMLKRFLRKLSIKC